LKLHASRIACAFFSSKGGGDSAVVGARLEEVLEERDETLDSILLGSILLDPIFPDSVLPGSIFSILPTAFKLTSPETVVSSL
jgi:hypothetical protein